MKNKIIGERIRSTRKARNLTLQDVADDIGVARSTIQRYETGFIRKVKLPVIEAIARSLNVNPSWLICESDIMERQVTRSSLDLVSEDGNDHTALTTDESTHIRKYRTLDDRGRENVDRTLDYEYQRTAEETRQKKRKNA